MKFPWSSPKEKEKTTLAKNPSQDVVSLEKKSSKSTLTVDGVRYEMNALSEEIKDLVTSIKIADAQLRIHEDTIRVLAAGKKSIYLKIEEKLRDIQQVS